MDRYHPPELEPRNMPGWLPGYGEYIVIPLLLAIWGSGAWSLAHLIQEDTLFAWLLFFGYLVFVVRLMRDINDLGYVRWIILLSSTLVILVITVYLSVV